MNEALRKFLSKYAGIILIILAIFSLGLFYRSAFKKGVEKTSIEKTKAEIVTLKTKANETIIKERLLDKGKKIHEISSDIDRILDDK